MISHVHKRLEKSQFPIDQMHKAFKQNWEKVIPATRLMDLDNQT